MSRWQRSPRSLGTPAVLLEEQLEKERDYQTARRYGCFRKKKRLTVKRAYKIRQLKSEVMGTTNTRATVGAGESKNSHRKSDDDLIREIQIQRSKGKKLVKNRSREQPPFIILLFKPLI